MSIYLVPFKIKIHPVCPGSPQNLTVSMETSIKYKSFELSFKLNALVDLIFKSLIHLTCLITSRISFPVYSTEISILFIHKCELNIPYSSIYNILECKKKTIKYNCSYDGKLKIENNTVE